MGSSVSSATPMRLSAGFSVREFEPGDFGRLVEFVADSQLSYLCVAAGHLRRASLIDGIDWTRGTLVAASAEAVVGFALIEQARDSKTGQLTVAMDPRWARGPEAGRLLADAVELAKRLGVRTLETQICRQTSLALFQDAGLRTLSSMSAGGVTDLALAVA